MSIPSEYNVKANVKIIRALSLVHPSVTGMVPLYAGRHAGLSVSIFNTGGTLSFALGPLFIIWYAATFRLEAVPATMLIGFSIAVFIGCGFRIYGFIFAPFRKTDTPSSHWPGASVELSEYEIRN
jgi:hypothetical protein